MFVAASLGVAGVLGGLGRFSESACPAFHAGSSASSGGIGQLAGFAAVPLDESHPAPSDVAFHTFFYQNGSAAWVHYRSSDLVHWDSVVDQSSPTGSAGGSVFSISHEVSPQVNSSIVAVSLSSATTPDGAITAATATTVELNDFSPFSDSTTCGGDGVICPSEVTPSAQLGGAAAFQVPQRNGSIAAVVACNGTDLLFFESQDLVTWKSTGPALETGSQSPVTSAELFTLHDEEGSAVITWSTVSPPLTSWSRGTWNPATLEFTETARGVGDTGSFSGAHSTLDRDGERVQIGTIPVATAGCGSVLSLPRQAYNRPDGTVGFRAHPSVWTLHGSRANVPFSNMSLSTGAAYNLTSLVAAAPLQTHIKTQIGFYIEGGQGNVSLDLLGGHGGGGITIGIAFNASNTSSTCQASAIQNNSDSSGTFAAPEVALNASEFGIPLAEQCRGICCTTPGCAFWTVTDPQPNSDDHICWLKQSDGALLPNGCQHYHSGHCWSGAVGAVDAGTSFDVTVNGVPLPKTLGVDHQTNGESAKTSIAWIDVEAFVDHSVTEIFFNDGEAAHTVVLPELPSATVAQLRAGLDATGERDSPDTIAFFSASAWVMDTV